MRRFLSILMLFVTLQSVAADDSSLGKTLFQAGRYWTEEVDIRSDVAIVYSTDVVDNFNFELRCRSYRNAGYKVQFMTGISWGYYNDYFNGKWDGSTHWDEAQCAANNDTLWHTAAKHMPYIVPTENFINYIKEKQIKRAIDDGISVIYLEEPEFFAKAGYSDAFKREWKAYYGTNWVSPSATIQDYYKACKLMTYLFKRAVQEVFTYAKQYGSSKGMDVKCYLATHSLLNYSEVGIVSPMINYNALGCVDGFKAQVWTGTARQLNYYNGQSGMRIFEKAFLEYGAVNSMMIPGTKGMVFDIDPIEDNQKMGWNFYKQGYEATYVAQLMYPEVDTFSVVPWPDRLYRYQYPTTLYGSTLTWIPSDYDTQVLVMMNAANKIPKGATPISGSERIRVGVYSTMMYQRSPKVFGGYQDLQLSNFYGQVLPLVERGIPVGITHMENVHAAADLDKVRVLVLSYANQKPLDSLSHKAVADWVNAGGVLIYCAKDDDSYQRVNEWWNNGISHYGRPSRHLLSLLGLDRDAKSGRYAVGKGVVYIMREDPKNFVLTSGGDADYFSIIKQAYEVDACAGTLEEKNYFKIYRGPYLAAAVVSDNAASSKDFTLRGSYIDLFDPALPAVTSKTIHPGEQALLIDLDKVADKTRPQVLAASVREYDEQIIGNSYSFYVRGRKGSRGVMRILLKEKPMTSSVTNRKTGETIAYTSSWDKASNTLLLRFTNTSDGENVRFEFPSGTGIVQVKQGQSNTDTPFYDIWGRNVGNDILVLPKGIYIRNGKKFINLL